MLGTDVVNQLFNSIRYALSSLNCSDSLSSVKIMNEHLFLDTPDKAFMCDN